MKLLPKSDILFSATKDELIHIRTRPKPEYNSWLSLKKTQQVIDNLLSYQKILKMNR